MELTIKGRIPSKKNSTRRVIVNGRLIQVPSIQFRDWHEEQMWILKGKQMVEKPSSVTIEMYSPDRKRADLSNKAESIMDLLVDAGILEDDNWFVIPELQLYFRGVDKENPRAVVTIR